MNFIVLGFFAVLAGLGIASSFVVDDDNSFEEYSEEAIEEYLEDIMDLSDGSLDGKVDLSPLSKEKK